MYVHSSLVCNILNLKWMDGNAQINMVASWQTFYIDSRQKKNPMYFTNLRDMERVMLAVLGPVVELFLRTRHSYVCTTKLRYPRKRLLSLLCPLSLAAVASSFIPQL